MKNWIIMLMGLLVIVGEILYDHWCWRKGLDDKPTSTWLRGFAIAALALVAAFMLSWPFFFAALFAGLFYWATHWLLFNPALNLTRPGKSIGYKKKGELWYGISWKIEYFVKIWVWYVAWLFVFKFDYVMGNYPTQGTWWELFKSFITFS